MISQCRSRECKDRLWTRFVWANNSHLSIFAGTANESCYLFLSLSGQLVYSHKSDYYCTILSHYLQLLAKVLQNRCLKNFAQIAGKYLCRILFLSAAACYFVNKTPTGMLSWKFWELLRTPLLQSTLKLLFLWLWN